MMTMVMMIKDDDGVVGDDGADDDGDDGDGGGEDDGDDADDDNGRGCVDMLIMMM